MQGFKYMFKKKKPKESQTWEAFIFKFRIALFKVKHIFIIFSTDISALLLFKKSVFALS